jgi:hypothetical protein
MKPLSNDLRQRILAAVDRHEGSPRKLPPGSLLMSRRSLDSCNPVARRGHSTPGRTPAGPNRPSTQRAWNACDDLSRRLPTPRSNNTSRTWASPAAS